MKQGFHTFVVVLFCWYSSLTVVTTFSARILGANAISHLQCLKTETIVMITVCTELSVLVFCPDHDTARSLTAHAHAPAMAHPILCWFILTPFGLQNEDWSFATVFSDTQDMLKGFGLGASEEILVEGNQMGGGTFNCILIVLHVLPRGHTDGGTTQQHGVKYKLYV